MKKINKFIKEWELGKYKKFVHKIIKNKNEYILLDDENLKIKFQKLKDGYSSECKSKKDALNYEIELLAIVGAVFEKVLNISLFEVQYIGAMVMNEEKIAELKTGEGKTYVAVLTAITNHLKGKRVHIITANEYLAKRDYLDTEKIYDFLNIQSSYISASMTKDEKKLNYNSDVVYIYAQELGFDYLRSNIVFNKDDRYIYPECMESVIIDEIDYVLIDEAKTPVVLSTKEEEDVNDEKRKKEIYLEANSFVEKIKSNKELYEINIEKDVATLTEEGIAYAEKYFNIENYSDVSLIEERHAIHQAMQAHFRMPKNDKYIVENNKIVLVDTSTGRLSRSKVFSNGLHQALQAKEGLDITPQNKILGQITYPNLFKLYDSMTGMSGTVKTEELEFLKNYNKSTIEIPTNKPIKRIDNPDYIFATREQKINAIIHSIEKSYSKKQPVLIGTDSIATSEEISAKLEELNIEHNVLNAKNHEMESQIIAKAGNKGAITVSTNMAGRGTDIKLDSDVINLGGLKVIGTYKNDSRRIDNQLRGRSGRQGDVGSSEFYISLEDDLIKGFAPTELKSMIYKHQESMASDEVFLSKLKILSKYIEKAQIKKEGQNFDSRLYNYQFDNILNNQRLIIYKERNEVLDSFDINNLTKNIAKEAVGLIFDRYEISSESDLVSEKDISEFINCINDDWDYEFKISKQKMTINELNKAIEDEFSKIYSNDKIKIYNKDSDEYKKVCILFNIDKYWTKHLSDLKNLELLVKFKDNPLDEYERDSVALFNTEIENIKIATVFSYLRNLEKSIKEEDESGK